jgi:putative membrane protein
MKNILTILKGMVMGIAEVIPGISGSTLALTMGIYTQFLNLFYEVLNIIKSFIKLITKKASRQDLILSIKKLDYKFAFFLSFGIILGISIFANILDYALTNNPQIVYSVFFGITLASLLIPINSLTKPKSTELLLFFFTFILLFLLFGLTPQAIENPSVIYIYLGGVIGISGMFMPGVSGSFLLLVMGLYDFIIANIKSITRFEINSEGLTSLIVFSLGLITGFLLFINLIKYLLKNHYRLLMAFIGGVLVASLRIMWPFFNTNTNNEIIKVIPELSLSTIFLLTIIMTSFVVTYLIIKKTNKNQQKNNIELEILND